MAKKGILKDKDNNNILPITRGELVLDSKGNQALRSNDFIATNKQAGLMSSEDKVKLDNFKVDIDLSNYVTVDKLDEEVNILNTKIDNIPTNDTDLSNYVTKNELNSLSNDINNKINNLDINVDLSGYVTSEYLNNELNNYVTSNQLNTSISSINNELSKKGTYSKPDTGIPKSDLSEEVQQELNNIGSMRIISHFVENSPIDGYEYELTINNPNEYHKFSGKLIKLTLKKLPSTTSDYVTNIMIDFTSGFPTCELKVPTIRWFNGIAPSIKENTRYQISIVDNLGVWAAYE